VAVSTVLRFRGCETVRTCLLQLPISIEWKWVRGHASSRKKAQAFTVPEVLNEAADDLAILARQSPICTSQDNDHWPEQTVSIIGPRDRMCGRLASELRYCCTAGDLRSSQVALIDPIGTQNLPMQSDQSKSSAADGCPSIGE
jgi:hypothetical protein